MLELSLGSIIDMQSMRGDLPLLIGRGVEVGESVLGASTEWAIDQAIDLQAG